MSSDKVQQNIEPSNDVSQNLKCISMVYIVINIFKYLKKIKPTD